MPQVLPPVPREDRLAVSQASAPTGFRFPQSFVDAIGEDDLPELYPLYFLLEQGGAVEDWTKILREQFPDRNLVPFVRLDGNDDVHCFDGNDLSGNPIVVLIHSFTTPGWEYRGEWFHFDSWLKGAREFHEEWLRDNQEPARG